MHEGHVTVGRERWRVRHLDHHVCSFQNPGEPILRIIDDMGFDVTITSPGSELETQAW